MAPLDGPRVEVVATAKIDLSVGDEIDCMGGYTTYGLCETADVTRDEALLPIGVAEGCRWCATSREMKCSRTTT